MTSNIQFLKSIFSDEYVNCHVTSFTYDPNNIPDDKHLSSWAGGYFKNQNLKPNSNQYFTISLFNPDEAGKARRRKQLFISTHVIVLDDVKEKLPLELVQKLPHPSYILETSQGSEQWGYILTTPETNRSKIENLMDGLVTQGVCPSGKDPGMKGVTRYVRLPESINNKNNKLIDGEPFECRLTSFSPYLSVTVEELAEPFQIDLTRERREGNVSGAANVPDHPLFNCGINVKSIRSDGRYDITCPWVDEHTGSVDNGSAMFTNADGTIGFKCHHGACEGRTRNDLLSAIDLTHPNFKETFDLWYANRLLSDYAEEEIKENKFDIFITQLRHENPREPKARHLATEILKNLEPIPEIDKHYYYTELCDIMGWSKVDFGKILKDLRAKIYEKDVTDFYKPFIYIKEHNKFYDTNTKIFYTPEAFQNSFSDEDSEARKEALMNGKVTKVDKIDFSPKLPIIYEKDGIKYGNTWSQVRENVGTPGDCSPWLEHFDQLGWDEHRDHMLKFMAYTILKPEIKINHILLLGGMEGTGKDFVLYPLIRAMGEYSNVIQGSELLDNNNEYLFNKKYLHVNETELGDHGKANEVSVKLKPLGAAPPDTLRLNMKFISQFKIQNIVNVTMTTNSQTPIKLQGPSRRFYAVWSDLNVRNTDDEPCPKWLNYFDKQWTWMKNGGVDKCIYYLRNHVDISNFNPGTAPLMTEFLKTMQEDSKPPMQQTIEAFIANRIGCFSHDLVGAVEASETLKSGLLVAEQFMYTKSEYFTPIKVAKVLSEIRNCKKIRARGEHDMRLFAVRNVEQYENLGLQEVWDAYHSQQKQPSIQLR